MNEEKAFLATLRAHPADDAARLAYADWLEEHDDARGELIRIESEIRTLPIHSDRYWELKPRRQTLLKLAKWPWLMQMGYGGTDYEPTFANVPSGWKERWRLLREFTERWHAVPMGDVGGPIRNATNIEKEIDPALLGVAPPALREWLAFIRDLDHSDKRYGASRFGLGNNDDYSWFDIGTSISFLNFDSGREHCSVRKAMLNNPDPPVEYGMAGRAADIAFSSITTFAFQYLMSTWCDTRAALKDVVRVQRSKELAQRLADAFPVHSTWDGIEIYERTNLIVFINQDRFFTADELNLHMMVLQPATCDDIPTFIWDYPRGASSGFGVSWHGP